MDVRILVEAELARHPWSSPYEIAGPAVRIPDALRALMVAQADSEFEQAYWRLENAVREGLWVLYREMVTGKAIAAREVLEIAERDPERLLAPADFWGPMAIEWGAKLDGRRPTLRDVQT
ncbi:hypothetical protein [Corallococcus sp. 4LFB]|uniref:hypothetical protein n=1 Tax=Corallococcus sp. 4LFB TaxID=3383249 RepID=UPI00397706BB